MADRKIHEGKGQNTKNEKIEPEVKQDEQTVENANPEEQVDVTDEKDQEEKQKEAVAKEEQLEKLEKQLEEMSDKHLRLQAEFDNFRRRTLKEKAELIKSGGESVLISILPIIDDFERAIESMKSVPDDDIAKQGTLLIYNKFKEFLKQNNVREIEAMNQDFDVDLHEAVTKIPAPDKKHKGKVVDVIQKGYSLNDKVIRFAKVVVGE